MRLLAMSALIAVLGLLSGCGGLYINIPKQPEDLARHDPNDGTVWRIEVAALTRVLNERTEAGGYTIKLPEGTHQNTYDWIIARLPAGGSSWTQTGGFTPIYEVAAIYVRGANGQVDIIRPGPGDSTPAPGTTAASGTAPASSSGSGIAAPGGYSGGQLVSVFLDYNVDGWYAKRSRIWNAPVRDALVIANPNAPPATAK